MKKRPETDYLSTDKLLLDAENPRLAEEQKNQNAAALALATTQGIPHVLKITADIVENGLDPLNPTAVVRTKKADRFKVIEGNRRLLSIRILDSPALVGPLLSTAQSRRLNKLSDDFAEDPISEIFCVIFDDEDQARHWITLRHTGQNEGVGLVEWGSEEIDRYQARHDGLRSPAGQVIEFVEKHGVLSDEARESDRKIFTNLERVLSDPYARQKLGVDVKNKEVIALVPAEKLAKSLGRLVDDFSTKFDVNAIREKADRKAYVGSLPKSVVPAKSARMDTPVPLDKLTAKPAAAKKKTAPKAAGKKADTPRSTVVPKNSQLEIENKRIRSVHTELTKLSANSYTQACSVLSRVFLEMSVDHYLEVNKLEMLDKKGNPNQNPPLASRIERVTEDMFQKKTIAKALRKAIDNFAKGNHAFGPGLQTFHEWVHNRYWQLEVKELFTAWDQLEPFFEVIWAPNPEDEE